MLGLGAGVGGTGNTQVVLQFAACELQNIIQLVVVEVRGVESPEVGATTLGVVCAKAGPDAAITVQQNDLEGSHNCLAGCKSSISIIGRSWDRADLGIGQILGYATTSAPCAPVPTAAGL